MLLYPKFELVLSPYINFIEFVINKTRSAISLSSGRGKRRSMYIHTSIRYDFIEMAPSTFGIKIVCVFNVEPNCNALDSLSKLLSFMQL